MVLKRRLLVPAELRLVVLSFRELAAADRLLTTELRRSLCALSRVSLIFLPKLVKTFDIWQVRTIGLRQCLNILYAACV